MPNTSLPSAAFEPGTIVMMRKDSDLFYFLRRTRHIALGPTDILHTRRPAPARAPPP